MSRHRPKGSPLPKAPFAAGVAVMGGMFYTVMHDAKRQPGTLDTQTALVMHVELVRELALQPEGPRLAADGTRCVSKFAKRCAGDGWAIVDHSTRMVRRLPPGQGSSDDDDDDDDDDD